MSSFFKGILIACIQLGYPEGIVSSQCSSCKSCTSAAPIEACCGRRHQELELARYCPARNWGRWRCKMIQVTKHKHWLWNFCKKQWKELVSSQSSQAPLSLPNHQHSRDSNISSWVASSGTALRLIPSCGILLWGCCPPRNWSIPNCKLVFENSVIAARQKYWGARARMFDLHYSLLVPHNRVGVESLCGIKPEIKLLFFVAFPLGEHIGMESIWFSSYIA